MTRKKPVGWRGEPERHSKAARGIKTTKLQKATQEYLENLEREESLARAYRKVAAIMSEEMSKSQRNTRPAAKTTRPSTQRERQRATREYVESVERKERKEPLVIKEKRHSITPKQREVLEALHKLEWPATSHGISTQLVGAGFVPGWQLAAHTNSRLQSLEKRGLVEALKEKSPRGGKQWQVTPAGRRLLQEQ